MVETMKITKHPETRDCLWISDCGLYEPPVRRRSPGYKRRAIVTAATVVTLAAAFVGTVMICMWLVGKLFA